MTLFLLDTNIVSDLVRNPNGVVARKIKEKDLSTVFTSIIVASEIRYGLSKKASPKLAGQVNGVLRRLLIAPFESPADVYYGRLRADLASRGQTIGNNDMLIAAHALALGCVLVTANEREFSRIPDLIIENWPS